MWSFLWVPLWFLLRLFQMGEASFSCQEVPVASEIDLAGIECPDEYSTPIQYLKMHYCYLHQIYAYINKLNSDVPDDLLLVIMRTPMHPIYDIDYIFWHNFVWYLLGLKSMGCCLPLTSSSSSATMHVVTAG